MAIVFEDLADYDGIVKALKNLSIANEKFGDASEATNDRVKKSIGELYSEMVRYKQLIESLKGTKGLRELQGDVVGVVSAYKNQNTVLSQNQSLVESNSKTIAQMQERLAQLSKEYAKLDLAQKEDVKRKREIERGLTQTTRAVTALTSATETAGRTVKAAENSFNALKQQTRDLKRQLDGIPNAYDKGTGKINEQNRAVVALNDQYQKNIKLIGQVERGQKNFRGNVGNYPTGGGSSAGSVAAGIGSKALGAGLAIAGLDSLYTGLEKAGDIILQFDSLDSALQVVSNDTALFTQRQEMLRRVSDDLGQDLSVVEKTYTNLTASSKGTRLEGEATDDIFEKVVGTMGRLKKSGEVTEGALLAIGQMMSKGTIQSEELRGQLGERIPGAFNIMAKALGVTTSKLGDMLKAGDVLAVDALPKFAAELERTFNPNHERRVEGLAANLARLRNEGVEWVKSINIGDSAGAFIGNITEMARSVRQFFSSAVSESTRNLAEQTQKVNDLEAALPGLLSRYDELKSKSKLSTDEQKELQTVVNNLVNLAPSAATGFDAYGNALDVNKGKVMAFTQAQRDLNAELNKVAIADLKRETTANLQQADLTQRSLNKGTKQRSFNFMPYFLRSDEEKRMATDKNAVRNRETALTDEDRRNLQKQLQDQNKQVESSITQRLQLGDKLDAATIRYVEQSGSAALKQYKVVTDYNDKIADLTTKQADLLLKGDKDSLKQREGILKELKVYQDKKKAILNPTLPGSKAVEEKAGLSKSEQAEANKQLRESLSKAQATTGDRLADLNNERQVGIIDEQTFIEQRLKITLEGLNTRQAMLEKAGKKEADDYINIQKEKKKADTEYSRSQLQLDLKTNKATTDKSLAGLDRQNGEGDLSELAYIDKRHELVVAGIKRDQVTIKEAGQVQTELYKATDTALEEEQAEHFNKRLVAIKKAWKDELTITRDGLKEIDQEASLQYETRLAEDAQYYSGLRKQIEDAQAGGKISATQARDMLHLVDIDQSKAELAIFREIVGNSKQLTHDLIQDRIDQLNNYIAYSGASEKELAEYKKQIADLEKQQRNSDAATKSVCKKRLRTAQLLYPIKNTKTPKRRPLKRSKCVRPLLTRLYRAEQC